MQLTNENDIRLAMGYQAAGTTDIEGNILDMQGGSSLAIVATLGPIVGGAVSSMKVQEGDASDGSDMTDVPDASFTISDAHDDKVFAIEVPRILKRYARCVLLRETQNLTLYSAIAFIGDLRTAPPLSNHSTFAGKTQVGR